MRRARSGGFTLIELMVTIVILAIMVAIAFPSFEATMRSNRLATTTNEMIAALSLARSEAIRNTRGSFVCASEDGATCSGDEDWSQGWLVARNGAAAGAIEVIRIWDARTGMQVEGPTARLEFDGRGRAVAPADLGIRPLECGEQLLSRTIVVNQTGRIAKEALTSCE